MSGECLGLQEAVLSAEKSIAVTIHASGCFSMASLLIELRERRILSSGRGQCPGWCPRRCFQVRQGGGILFLIQRSLFQRRNLGPASRSLHQGSTKRAGLFACRVPDKEVSDASEIPEVESAGLRSPLAGHHLEPTVSPGAVFFYHYFFTPFRFHWWDTLPSGSRCPANSEGWGTRGLPPLPGLWYPAFSGGCRFSG
jgi:hypothetical protein